MSDCDNHAEWAQLPCRTYQASQPASGDEIPFTQVTYDFYGQLRTESTKNSSSTLRTITVVPDGAGRAGDITTTASLGTAISKQRNIYDQATGKPTGTQSLDGSGVVTASISRTYDALGRPATYTDADGNTSTTTYNLLSRRATVNDGKATQTFTYNGGDEKRGLPTQLVDGQAGTFSATYTIDGDIETETRPDGITVRHYYSETGQPTGLEYVTDPSCSSAICTLYYDYAGFDTHGSTRWDASSFSNAGFGYDDSGRLTGTRQETPGCALRTYAYDTSTNRTKAADYTPDSNGNCQDATATTRTWNHDTADRVSSHTFDALGRTLPLPADDTIAGTGSGDIQLTYYVNDMTRTVTKGSTQATNTLDVLTNRYRSYSTTTGGTTVNRTNHYSNDSDNPCWIAEGTWYTRAINGLDGLSAQYTGSSAHLEWQITNLHGDIVAMRLAGATGLTATFVTDEHGRSSSGTAPRYGWLGSAQRSADNPGGLITMGVRMYNPATGRFLSMDPIYGGNANSYDYCNGDPVNCTDITGMVSKIYVPSNYIYSTRLGHLHDYCTTSPDSWFKADFRGPCALHDLCYERKGQTKRLCDTNLRYDLANNCNYAYGTFNPLRYTCREQATRYWAWVVVVGRDPKY